MNAEDKQKTGRKSEDVKTSVERYLQMTEKEKDAEIEKAVVRLQRRIREILYLLEVERQGKVAMQKDERKEE